ncbi:LytTR family DNA-binding domain-containing protein [uncultured Tenacibaculum sp.]|uniref:LytR/AlgR family response regulator transcription factor n=1 Tax=uncultured Tenacibaculum sp. TaxID=174713 RepID=UPI00261CDFD4|nr:LytTR family DNA-binding domain-containing protein [uncultured Tenacibaculum sp.]
MKNSIRTYLLQPYPFYYQGKSLKIILLLFFLMTFLFNYAFEPFNVEYTEHKMNYFWITLIHSLTPVIILSFLFIIGSIWKLEEKWNVVKEAFLIFSFFLMVGLVQFLIRDLIYDNPNNWSLQYLYEEIRNTFLVGTLFVLILIPLNFNRLNTKHGNRATLLNNAIGDKLTTEYPKTNNIKVNDFEFNNNQFLFAKAEGNYTEVYLNAQNPTKKLIRTTLKNLETLLQAHPNILKTHRSYLVNCNYIEKIEGNAQGYQLHIGNYKVPVSRNKIQKFNSYMKRE